MITFLSLFFSNPTYAEPIISIDDSLIKRKSWRTGQKMGHVDMVEIDGLVETPIYRKTKTKYEVYVEINTQDPNETSKKNTEDDSETSEPTYFKLDLSSNVIAVDDAFVQANGLEVKTTNKRLVPLKEDYKVGGEIKYVVIPKLHVGNMTLHNVTAYVTSSESTLNLSGINGPHLGLGALNVSYAILHSQGVIQFMPKNDGKELLNNISKEHIRYNSSDWHFITSGEKKETTIKDIQIANNIIVDIEVADQKASVLLLNTQKGNFLTNIPNGLEKYGSHGTSYYPNLPSTWTSLALGSQELDSSWFFMLNEPFATNFLQYDGFLGTDTLSFLDIAVSPIDSSIAIKKIKEYNVSILEKSQLKALRTEIKNMDEIDESSANELANLEKTHGSLQASKNNFNEAIKQNPNTCINYLNLGKVALQIEDFDLAEKNIKTASKMYHDWWDRPLEERLMITKNQAEQMDGIETDEEKEEIKAAGWIYKQPDSCRGADTLLPVAVFLNGKDQDIFANNYYKNLDLDDSLARITGNYALLNGNHQLANEAYRQALLLEPSPNPLNRLGLALYMTDIGDWKSAKSLFEEVLFIDHYDPLSVILYAENLRKNEGDEAVLSMLQQWIEKIPSHSGIHVAYVRELQKQGSSALPPNTDSLESPQNADLQPNTDSVKADNKTNSEDLELAMQSAENHFIKLLMRGSNSQKINCYAFYLITIGRTDEAQAILSDDNETDPEYLLARAQLYKAIGEEAKSIQHLEKAKRQGFNHPGYVLLQE